MKKNITLIIVLLSFIFVPQLDAQFGINVGIAVPIGDFADDGGAEGDGFAKTGFNVGLSYDIPFGAIEGLSWTITGSLLYNAMDWDKAFDLVSGEDMDGGKYLNIPLLTGLKIKYGISETAAMFGMATAGVNLSTMTDAKYTDGNYWEEYSVNTVGSFAFSIGAGVILMDRYSLSLNYMGLGEPDHEIDYSDSDGYSGSFDEEQKISAITITAGIFF